MNKKLVMGFLTDEGAKFSINLDAPKENLTEAEVRPVMQSIVTENAFNIPKGDLVEVKSARIITTTEEILI